MIDLGLPVFARLGRPAEASVRILFAKRWLEVIEAESHPSLPFWDLYPPMGEQSHVEAGMTHDRMECRAPVE